MRPLTDPEFANEFATNWIKNWNNRDVEAVLSHFDDDCIFESPLGKTYAGSSVIRGKSALRAYWMAALGRIKSLKFELESAVWDPKQRTLVVFSIAQLDQRTVRACEAMLFAPNGRQHTGRAYYGYASE